MNSQEGSSDTAKQLARELGDARKEVTGLRSTNQTVSDKLDAAITKMKAILEA